MFRSARGRECLAVENDMHFRKKQPRLKLEMQNNFELMGHPQERNSIQRFQEWDNNFTRQLPCSIIYSYIWKCQIESNTKSLKQQNIQMKFL